MLYEAARRLGGALVIVDAIQGKNGKVWIRPDSQQQVIETVARDLVRGHRSKATPASLAVAFDALVAELRVKLPRFAAYGLVHEQPRNTLELKQQLLATMERLLSQGQ
jgi:hypothetical protein